MLSPSAAAHTFWQQFISSTNQLQPVHTLPPWQAASGDWPWPAPWQVSFTTSQFLVPVLATPPSKGLNLILDGEGIPLVLSIFLFTHPSLKLVTAFLHLFPVQGTGVVSISRLDSIVSSEIYVEILGEKKKDGFSLPLLDQEF